MDSSYQMQTFQQDPDEQEYLVTKGESAHLKIDGKGTKISNVQPQASVGACCVPRGPADAIVTH